MKLFVIIIWEHANLVNHVIHVNQVLANRVISVKNVNQSHAIVKSVNQSHVIVQSVNPVNVQIHQRRATMKH